MTYNLVVDKVKTWADDVDKALPDVRKGALEDALRYYNGLKTSYEELDKERKRVYEQVENLSRQTIPEMMDERGVKTITLKDISYRFTVQVRMTVSMPDKENGMIWLRKNGLENLIQETVNSSSLTAAVKQRIEKDGLDVPPELFNTNTMNVTSMTKV